MDANLSNPDDLNELERRLSAWSPNPRGLHPDAMLFAAGRASVRRGKVWLAWPIASGCLAVITAALGAWLAIERTERLALVHEIHARPAELAPDPGDTPTTEPLAATSYLVLRREWEQHPGSEVRTTTTPADAPIESAPVEPQIFRAWPADRLFESL
jgi:hypothetical protein